MKIKKMKPGRRSLALGELGTHTSSQIVAIDTDPVTMDTPLPTDISEDNLQVPGERKSRLRRSLGGKVEKPRQSSRFNKWSILDILGFGSKKKARKSMQPESTLSIATTDSVTTSDQPTVSSDQPSGNSDLMSSNYTADRGNQKNIQISDLSTENNGGNSDEGMNTSHAGHTPKKAGQIKPIDTSNAMDLGILQENTTLRRRSSRFSTGKNSVDSKSLSERVPLRDIEKSLNKEAPDGKQKASIKKRGSDKKKAPDITQNMISETKKRLRHTSDSPVYMSSQSPAVKSKHSRSVKLERKPPVQPRSCGKMREFAASTPNNSKSTWIGSHNGDKAQKPPIGKRRGDTLPLPKPCPSGPTSKQSRDKMSETSVSRSEQRARSGVHNIRHAGSTPPRHSRRQSISANTPNTNIQTTQNKRLSNTFAPAVLLKYADDDDLEKSTDELKITDTKAGKIADSAIDYVGKQSNTIVPLTDAELEALDIATQLTPDYECDSQKMGVPKRESLMEALRKSPLLSPECHLTPIHDNDPHAAIVPNDDNFTPALRESQSHTSLLSSVSSTLSKGLRSSKTSLRNFQLKKTITPQVGDIGATTPRSRMRAVKRAHSIAVSSNIASLRGPSSPMLTPMSSVAKELEGMKMKRRRKEPTLEEIIKEKRKSKQRDGASKKPPPKPPRKTLIKKLSSSRLRRKSNLGDLPPKGLPQTEITVKRKTSIKEILRRKPPPKPARRSLQNSLTGSADVSSASIEHSDVASSSKSTTSIGESVRKLRRKLSRAGDLGVKPSNFKNGEKSRAQVTVFNAGHTPKAPRGRKDERLV